MRYLVDGYNFAHRAGLHSGRLEAVRGRVEARLRSLSSGGDKVTLVWDASGAAGWSPQTEGSGKILHLFARGSFSADEEILTMVRESDAPHGLCVVSDDNGVVRPARHMGARTMSVAEVLERLGGASPRGTTASALKDDDPGDEKPPPPTGAELDEWERLFEGEGDL